MAEFSYSARDRAGNVVTGAVNAGNKERALIQLRGQRLLVLAIEPVKSKDDSTGFSLNPLAYRRLNAGDLEHDFHQLAVMLRAGLSLMEALDLVRQNARIGAKPTWQALRDRIAEGSSFAEALREHALFSEFTIQLVTVGEQTGHLAVVLDQAAEEIKSSLALKKQIVTALRYPVVTLLFAIGLVAFMLIKLVPEIKKLLEIMGKPMPPITQALIDISDWTLAHLLVIVALLVLSLTTFFVLYAWAPSRWWIDRLALKLPIFGYVFRLSGTVLFARAMGLLLGSGVVIVDALVTMANLHVNRFMGSRVEIARNKLLEGASLAEALPTDIGYLPLLLHMIRVGENSGMLDPILKEMADYHEELLKRLIAWLTGMIAPAMTVIVGGVVGFVYAAFLVAMFTAAGGSPS